MSDSPTLHPIRLAALVAFSIAFSAGAWAQAQFKGTTLAHPHPSFLTGDADKAVIGQLTDDATADIAVLQGGDIVLLDAPARQRWFRQSIGSNAGTYTDIAILPADAPGAPDKLLALCPAGLVRLRWNPSSGLLEDDVLLAGGDWCNARELLRVVPGADGMDHVATVTAGGDVVYAGLENGNLGDGATFDTNVLAVAFAALDFEGDGGIEFALDDGTGLRIFAGGYLIHQSLPNASPDPHLLRLPENGNDALVWVTSFLPIQQVLTVVRMDDSQEENVIYESFLQIASPCGEFVVADYFGDLHMDLLGASKVDGVMRVLLNQHVEGNPPPTFTFFFHPDHEATFWFDAAEVYGGDDNFTNPPALAVGDLDGDGDADPVLAGHEGTSIKVFSSDGINQEALRPLVSPCLGYIETPNGTNTTVNLNFFITSPEAGTNLYLKGEVWSQRGESMPVTLWDTFTVPTGPSGFVIVPLEGTVSNCEEGCGTFHLQVWTVEIVEGEEVWAGPATTLHISRTILHALVQAGEALDQPPCPGGAAGSNQPPVIPP